ncbi:MAG: hypothetical protein R2684_15655 [Pyrinomonadaceae bacterium]
MFACRSCGRSCIQNPKGRHGRFRRNDGEVPTKSELILKLRALADKLGRSPMNTDVVEASKNGRGYTINTYTQVFGTFNRALDAARLERNTYRKWDRDSMLEQLREYSSNLGRPLTKKDVVEGAKLGLTPMRFGIESIFGNYTNALREAGVAQPERTRDTILLSYAHLARKMGRHPTRNEVRELRKQGSLELPTKLEIRRLFGGYKGIKKLVDLPKKVVIAYSTEELIEHLKTLGATLGRKPRARDIDKFSSRGKAPSSGTYLNRFDSLNHALTLAGFKIQRTRISDEEMIDELRALYKSLKKPFTYKDLEKAYADGLIASPLTISRRLGNLERVNNLASGKLVAP